MSEIPAIGAINNFQDVKKALDTLRSWLVTNRALAKIEAVRGLVYVDANGDVVSRSPDVDIQSIGHLIVGSSGESVDSTKYYKITVKGTTIKLAVLA